MTPVLIANAGSTSLKLSILDNTDALTSSCEVDPWDGSDADVGDPAADVRVLVVIPAGVRRDRPAGQATAGIALAAATTRLDARAAARTYGRAWADLRPYLVAATGSSLELS
jgi:hypothetical protein